MTIKEFDEQYDHVDLPIMAIIEESDLHKAVVAWAHEASLLPKDHSYYVSGLYHNKKEGFFAIVYMCEEETDVHNKKGGSDA